MTSKRQLYGRSAKDLLNRWDTDQIVFTIEMGGLGPGYEQALQIAMFEMLRYLVNHRPRIAKSKLRDNNEWPVIRAALWDLPSLNGLGLSGAQAGAATQLAAHLYLDGPIKTLAGEKTRTIQVSKTFPQLA